MFANAACHLETVSLHFMFRFSLVAITTFQRRLSTLFCSSFCNAWHDFPVSEEVFLLLLVSSSGKDNGTHPISREEVRDLFCLRFSVTDRAAFFFFFQHCVEEMLEDLVEQFYHLVIPNFIQIL